MSQCLVFFMIVYLWQAMQCYYISYQLFDWQSSDEYCTNYCKSSLASIHHTDDQQNAYNTIASSNSIFSTNTTWLGLSTPSDIHHFAWSDGTSFNYGDTVDGNAPWAQNNPDASGLCVSMVSDSNYLWDDRLCSSQYRALCNDCNGIFNKYIVLPITNLDYDTAKTECHQLNTDLASFHSQRDYQELMSLCSLDIFDSTADCWIGLKKAHENNQWRFEDGTAFTYGGDEGDNGLWSAGYPKNNHYATLAANDSYHLQDSRNTTQHGAICNIHSALCESVSTWSAFEGEASFVNCTMSIRYNGVTNVVMMTDKQFWNGEAPEYGVLRIDYLYNMDMYRNEGAAGIIISDSECHQYKIGISKTNNVFSVFLEYISDAISTALEESVIPHNITNDTDYLLSITVQSNADVDQVADTFIVFVNNVQYISHAHIQREHVLVRSGWSGYIGVFSDVSIVAKSLYISGTAHPSPILWKCATLSLKSSIAFAPSEEMSVTDAVLLSTVTDSVMSVNNKESKDYSLFIILGLVFFGCCGVGLICFIETGKKRTIRVRKHKQKVSEDSDEENNCGSHTNDSSELKVSEED